MSVRCATLVLVFAASAGGARADEAVPDLAAVEARALAARRAFRSGHVILEYESKFVYPETVASRARTADERGQYQIWFDESRMRLSYSKKDVGTYKSDLRGVEVRNFDGKGTHFHNPDLDGWEASVGRVESPGKIGLRYLVDPRLLGYVCLPLHSAAQGSKIDELVGTCAKLKKGVRHGWEDHDGRRVVRVEVSAGPPESIVQTKLVVCYDPNQGHNPVYTRWDMTEPSDGSVDWREIRCTHRQYPGGWYLAGYEYKASVYSRTESETVRVTDAWFNRPIPADRFAVRDFGLKPGGRIVNTDTNARTTFAPELAEAQVDTEKLLAQSAAHPPEPMAPLPRTVNPWLVGVCILAAAGGAVVLYRGLGRRRAAP